MSAMALFLEGVKAHHPIHRCHRPNRSAIALEEDRPQNPLDTRLYCLGCRGVVRVAGIGLRVEG